MRDIVEQKAKCTECGSVSTYTEWNDKTGEYYEQPVCMQLSKFDGTDAYVCPNCECEVDSDYILPVATVDTEVVDVDVSEYPVQKCPNCGEKLYSTRITNTHRISTKPKSECVTPVTVSVEFCICCGHTDYKVYVD